MATQLEQNLNNILLEKNEKIIPTNIRKDVTILGVTGTMEEKIDTSKLTAGPEDILLGKNALVNDQVVDGTIETVQDGAYLTTNTSVVNNTTDKLIGVQKIWPDRGLIDTGSNIKLMTTYSDMALQIGLTPEIIAKDSTVLGVTGTLETLDTSKGDAGIMDIIRGKIAYVDGGEVVGNMALLTGQTNVTNGVTVVRSDVAQSIGMQRTWGNREAIESGSILQLYTKYSDVATAIGLTPAKLVSGYTVLGVAGEAIAGGMDVSEGNATVNDLASGKIAFTNSGRIEGELPDVTDEVIYKDIELSNDTVNSTIDINVTNESDRIIRTNALLKLSPSYSLIASLVGLTPEKLVSGTTILGVTGTQAIGYDTSDATATKEDIIAGKTAYIADGWVTGTLTGGQNTYASGLTISNNGDSLRAIHTFNSKVLYNENNTITFDITNSDIVNTYGIKSNQIVTGNTLFGVEGTAKTADDAPQVYTSIEEMNADTSRVDGTFAIVHGTTYVGTYTYANDVWVQIGEPTENVETYNSLSLVEESSATQYEGLGATEEEITTVLDEIIGNEEEL